jgi:rhomboid family GlyGly-CTERM serine protease
VPAWTVGLCALALTLPVLHLATQLQFDREAILAGEWWRGVSGHFVHWSADHLFWDVATFAVLGILAERRSRTGLLACALASAVAVSAGLWILRPDVITYRGLSGIDAGLFALVATGMLRDARTTGHRPTAILAVAALGVLGLKLAWELTTGSALFVDAAAAGFQSMPLAHALGAVAGVTVGLLQDRWETPT